MDITLNDLDLQEAIRINKILSGIEVGSFDTILFHAKMEWVYPFGMLLTACAIRRFLHDHRDNPSINLCSYKMEGVSYASEMGFFQVAGFDKGRGPGEASGNSNYIPIRRINFKKLLEQYNSKSRYPLVVQEAIEEESIKIARVLTSSSNDELHDLLTFVIREMLRNIAEHAESNTAYICGQNIYKEKAAEVAIIDFGIGIKNSLIKNQYYSDLLNDDEALHLALRAGASSAFIPNAKYNPDDIWGNSGFGLYMISEICKELGGTFFLGSKSRYILIDKNGQETAGDLLFKGTALMIKIPTKKSFVSNELKRKVRLEGESKTNLYDDVFKRASRSSKGIIKKKN